MEQTLAEDRESVRTVQMLGGANQDAARPAFRNPVMARRFSRFGFPSESALLWTVWKFDMRVLLLYSNQSRDLTPAPPIGLSYVATATRAAGHEVLFLDLFSSHDVANDLRHSLQRFHPDMVGISVRNIDNVVCQHPKWYLGDLAELIALVRQTCGAKIVVGGPAISILGAPALEHLDADFAVVGEGETMFPQLLAAIEQQQPFHGIAGLCFRDNGRIAAVPPSRLSRFGASGMEQWIDWKTYERLGGTWTLQTKRGCPLQCIYCTYPSLEGRVCRRRTPAEIADEMEHVMRVRGPRTFEFVDSTFNVPVEHACEICEEIIRRRLKVNLTAMGINPLTVSRELLALMKRAGFNSMMITPESADSTMLKNLCKGFTVEDLDRTARLVGESGMSSSWFFLLGGPGETRDTAETTISFAEKRLNRKGCLSIFMTGIRVFPGTELEKQARAEGRLAADADLSKPFFYISAGVEESWLIERINGAVVVNPGVVHAAEEDSSVVERLYRRVLHQLGVPPPYWRFLPGFLRLWPVHRLRATRPFVGRPAGDINRTVDAEMPAK